LEHCSTILKIENAGEKAVSEEFTPKDVKRTALCFDEAIKSKRKAEVEKPPSYHCPELFSEFLQFIANVESNEILAKSLGKLPYVQSKEAPIEKPQKSADAINYILELRGFVNHVCAAGNLRGMLVLMKFLCVLLENSPESKAYYEMTLPGKGADSSSSDLSKISFPIDLLNELEKCTLIGREDIMKMIDLMNEKDRLQIFDSYPRLLIQSGKLSRLRAFEVRGSVAGFIGGVFVRPDTGYSYFEVTLKGCSLGALGVRVGWGLCGISTERKVHSAQQNSSVIIPDLPGDSDDSWTFDGSCGGHYFHNARILKVSRSEDMKGVNQDLKLKIETDETPLGTDPQLSVLAAVQGTQKIISSSVDVSERDPSPSAKIPDRGPGSGTGTGTGTESNVSSSTEPVLTPATTATTTTTTSCADDYGAITEALESIDKQIAEIDFSALLNTIRANSESPPPAKIAPETDPISDNPGVPDFVDYVKSLSTADSFDLLLDSQNSSPKGPETVNPFGVDLQNVSAGDGTVDLGSSGPVLDYAKIFIKMLKVGINISTISTVATRDAIRALLLQDNVCDEMINSFIIQQKMLDGQADNSTAVPISLEAGRKKSGTQSEELKVKARMSAQLNRKMAFAAGGIPLIIASNEDADDISHHQPFPPFPSTSDNDSSLPMTSSNSKGEVMWGTGTVVGCLLNTHTGAISFFLNGKKVGSEVAISMGPYTTHVRPVFSCTASAGLDINIGQSPFSFEPALAVSVGKSHPMVSLASLFDTYPVRTKSTKSSEKEKGKSKSGSQGEKAGGDISLEASGGGVVVEDVVIKAEKVRGEMEGEGGGEGGGRGGEGDNVAEDEEKEEEEEEEVDEDPPICRPVLESARSPFFRLGSPPISTHSTESSSSSNDPGSLDFQYEIYEKMLSLEEMKIPVEKSRKKSDPNISEKIPDKKSDVKAKSEDKIANSTRMILIEDKVANFVFHGITIETSIRLLPGAFSHVNSIKSVVQSDDILVGENKPIKRVIWSFGLKADGQTSECSLVVLENFSLQFVIRDGRKEGKGEEYFFSSPPNSLLPLVWSTVSIVINNSKNRNSSGAKNNISIVLGRTVTCAFFSPFLNSLLESSSCEVSKITLGGYVSSVEKKRKSETQKDSSSGDSYSEYANLLNYEETGNDAKENEKKENVSEEGGLEEKGEKDSREEKEESLIHSPPSSSTPKFRIKQGSKNSNWIGDICEFRFWVVPSTNETILNSLGRFKICGVETDLVVCLAFQEGIGRDLYDSTVLDGSVRARESIIVLEDCSAESSPESSLKSSEKVYSDSVWGFQVVDKTFPAENNIRAFETCTPPIGDKTPGSEGSGPGSGQGVKSLWAETVIPTGSNSSALDSFIFDLLARICRKFFTTAGNYLDADSGDIKVNLLQDISVHVLVGAI
jgi:hypothetical protein